MELLIPQNLPFSDSQSIFAHEMDEENVWDKQSEF